MVLLVFVYRFVVNANSKRDPLPRCVALGHLQRQGESLLTRAGVCQISLVKTDMGKAETATMDHEVQTQEAMKRVKDIQKWV